jgi:anion-transporting  ArsA/GET3 family ATPase
VSELLESPFVVVVGAGGVGKTTVAAALGLNAARAGHRTLVMTFDPSHRLKDALGVGEEAREREVAVPSGSLGEELPGELAASLLDARRTFDRLVARHAPDPAARDRILGNRFYDHLSGGLAGILEYMAVERLFEVAAAGRYERVVLDTPPTRQALDFLEAPERIISFLDSGVLKVALRPWFDAAGRFRPTAGWGRVGRRVEGYLDDLVGLDLLRDMAEFFQAFAPLYAGFRERAAQVRALLRAPETRFVLVAAPQEERIPDTLFFARRLAEGGYRLGPLVVNRIHPEVAASAAADPSRAAAGGDGRALLAWLGRRDHRGSDQLARLLGPAQPLVELPLLPEEPTDLRSLAALGRRLEQSLAAAGRRWAAGP